MSGDLNNPPESLSSEAAAALRELMSQLSRTLLAYRLYAPANALRQELFRQLVERFDQALILQGTFALELEATQVTCLGEVLVELAEQENHICVRLFREGVRWLRFDPGLTSTEVEGLLEALQTELGIDQNLADALWEAELPHVTHGVVDGFAELLESETRRPITGIFGKEKGGPEGPRQGGLVSRFERIITSLVGSPAPEPGELEGLDLELPEDDATPIEVIPIHERVASPLRSIGLEPAVITRELERWSEELRHEAERDLLTTVEEILFYLAELPTSALTQDDLAQLLSQLLLEWLLRGSFSVAGELMVRLERVGYEASHLVGLPLQVVRTVQDRALPELMRALEPGSGQALWDATDAALFLERFFPPPDEELVAQLGRTDLGEGAARLLASLLVRRTIQQGAVWAPFYSRTPVAVAKPALAELGERSPGLPETAAAFWQGLAHRDPDVRMQAVQSHPGPFDELLRDQLVELTGNEHKGLRCAALERLGRSGGAGAGPFLVNHARRYALVDMDPEEVATLVRALLAVGAERYLPFLKAQIDQLMAARGPLGIGEALGRARIEAPFKALLRALGRSGVPAALDLVREARGKARGAPREWCDDVWRELVADWMPRANSSGRVTLPPGADPTGGRPQSSGKLVVPDAEAPRRPSQAAIPVPAAVGALPPEADDEPDVTEEAEPTFVRVVTTSPRQPAPAEKPPPPAPAAGALPPEAEDYDEPTGDWPVGRRKAKPDEPKAEPAIDDMLRDFLEDVE